MRTFSEIIDEVVQTTQAPHLLTSVIREANFVLKDLDTNHDSDWALEEITVKRGDATLVSEGRVTRWTVPCNFRSMRAIRVDGCTYLEQRRPGLGQKATSAFWYQSGNQIIVSGCPCTLDIAYYARQRSFLYYDPAKRLLRSSDQCDWEYRATSSDAWTPYDGSTPDQLKVYDRHVNWIIADFSDAVVFGTLSGQWNSMGDARASAKYAQYSLAKDVIQRSRLSHLSAQL